MNISATHKNARIAPRKVRPLARLLRGMKVQDAEMQLKYLPGRAVRDVVLAVLKSAVANAKHNHDLKVADLTVEGIAVNAGFAFKRFRPASKGMAHPFKKRTSHITVTVTNGSPAPKASAKREKKKSDIVTITADQYAAEALDTDHEAHEEKMDDKDKADKNAGEATMPKSKEQEASGKMRSMQSGGDKKKSFRRKSAGA